MNKSFFIKLLFIACLFLGVLSLQIPYFNASIKMTQSTNVVTSLVFTPDLERIVAGSKDRIVRIYNNNNPPSLMQNLIQAGEQISSVEITKNKTIIYSASIDKHIRIYKEEQYSYQIDQDIQGDDSIKSIDASQDASILVSASYSGVATIYKFSQSSYSEAQIIKVSQNPLTGIRVSDDGQFLVVSGDIVNLYQNNGTNFKLIQSINQSSLSLDITFNFIVFTNPVGSIMIYSYSSQGMNLYQKIQERAPVNSIAINSGSHYIVGGLEDNSTVVYTNEGDKFVFYQRLFNVSGSIKSVQVADDGQFVGVGSFDHSMTIFFSCTVDFCDECQWQHKCLNCHPTFDHSTNDLCLCNNGKTVSQTSGYCVTCTSKGCLRCDSDEKCALCEEGTVKDLFTKNCVQTKYVVVFIIQCSLVGLVGLIIAGITLRKKFLIKNESIIYSQDSMKEPMTTGDQIKN